MASAARIGYEAGKVFIAKARQGLAFHECAAAARAMGANVQLEAMRKAFVMYSPSKNAETAELPAGTDKQHIRTYCIGDS